MFWRNGTENSRFHVSLMFFLCRKKTIYIETCSPAFKWCISEDSMCIVLSAEPLVCLHTWAWRRGWAAQMWSREITRSLCVRIWSQHASAASLSVQDNLIHRQRHTQMLQLWCLTKHTWQLPHQTSHCWTFKHFLFSKSAWIQKIEGGVRLTASNHLDPEISRSPSITLSDYVWIKGWENRNSHWHHVNIWFMLSRQHEPGLEISLWKWREFPKRIIQISH